MPMYETSGSRLPDLVLSFSKSHFPRSIHSCTASEKRFTSNHSVCIKNTFTPTAPNDRGPTRLKWKSGTSIGCWWIGIPLATIWALDPPRGVLQYSRVPSGGAFPHGLSSHWWRTRGSWTLMGGITRPGPCGSSFSSSSRPESLVDFGIATASIQIWGGKLNFIMAVESELARGYVVLLYACRTSAQGHVLWWYAPRDTSIKLPETRERYFALGKKEGNRYACGLVCLALK